MKTVLAAVGSIVGVLILILGLTWFVQGNDFFMYKVFAPQYEQVRRDTFEQSHAFRQGSLQELQSYRFEYIKADDEHKPALRKVILVKAADVPADVLQSDPDLYGFISQLKREETLSH